MPPFMKSTALAIAAAGFSLAAAPASAAQHPVVAHAQAGIAGDLVFDHGKKNRKDRRGKHYGHRNDRRYDRRVTYRQAPRPYYMGYSNTWGQPVRRDTRIWRGRDDRYYCRRDDGTTGLLVGAGVGALLGNEIAGRGDRTLGAIVGGAAGALLGRSIDRSSTRCG